MTHARAVKLYFQNSTRGAAVIKRLMKWKEDASLCENSRITGVKRLNTLVVFARIYNLDYKGKRCQR